MDRSLYVAMSGAKHILQAQTANSHNLSNVNTTGFRADLEQFRSMPVFGPGLPARVYAMVERPAVDFKPGAMQTTGRDLDIAIHGDGWFAVAAKDGSEAYSRAGSLQLSPEGLLMTADGLAIIGNGGPIAVPPARKIEIGADGTISIIPLGDTATTLAIVDQIKLVDPPLEQLEKRQDGLIYTKTGKPALASVDVKLVSGALESSNVSAVDELVDMIELARRFELQVKIMKTFADNDAAGAHLMRMA
ncbi:MAG: flagellar basal-body rod protein FlgF [Gammaproteobacteria bacterium]